MVVGDVLSCTTTGFYTGQAWQNTYFYRVISIVGGTWPASFAGVAQVFEEDVLSGIWSAFAGILSEEISMNSCQVYNLFNEGEVSGYIFPAPYDGNGVTAGNGPEIAYGFKQPSLRRRMNPGFKRFPGVVEGSVGEGGVIEAAALVTMNTVANLLRTTWASIYGGGVEIEAEPVIVKRIKEEDPDNPGEFTYRLPTSQAEMGANYFVANQWAPIPYTTTQNSRKRGRGM